MCAYVCECVHMGICVHVSALEGFRIREIVGLTTNHILHVIHFSLNRKWQEATQKIQELQASQEARADQEQRIKVSCSVPVPSRVW